MRTVHSADAIEQDQPEHQVLDMRLVPAALGCWAATLVALTLGWLAGVAIAVAAVVVAIGSWVVLLWAAAHRRERWRVVAVAALATMVLTAGFAAAAAWREHHVQAHPLRDFFGRTATVVAVIDDDAKQIRAGSFGEQRRWVVRASLQEFESRPSRVRAGGALIILAAGEQWAELIPGQVVRLRAKVMEPTRSDLTVAALRAISAPEPIGVPPWWQRLAADVRGDLSEAAARALPPAAAGLLPALVVGDTSALSTDVRDSFEIAGLQHLCVVSGANFTILLTALLALTRVLTAGPRTSAAAAVGAVVVFIVLARPDPSVLRAAAMGSVTVLALLTGRRKQALPALCAAVIGLLAVAPQLAVSAGFALSVVATAGLILLAPSWADWLRARGWWRAPAEIVAVSAGAFVVTLPLMVALSGRVSSVAIVANALVAPVVGVITVIGAVGAVLACVWIDAAVWVLWCARPPLWWLLGVADHLAAIPGATVTVRSGLVGGLITAAIVILLVAVLRWPRPRRLLTVAVLGIALVLVPTRLWQPEWPPAGWVLAMCDVGQGDGLALAVGPGSAVVIDTGPDPRSIRRCLDRLRITHVPLLVLTHPHADHIGGLSGAIRGRTVDAIATAPGELRPTTGGRCPTATPLHRPTNTGRPVNPAPTVAPGAPTVTPGVVTDGPGVLTDGSGVPTVAPGVVTVAPGVVTDGPGVVTDGPGVPTVAPGVVTDGPGVLTDGSGVPTVAPGVVTVAPGVVTVAPGVVTVAPGVPTDGPGVPTVAPGVPTDGPGVPTVARRVPTVTTPVLPFTPPTMSVGRSVELLASCPGISTSGREHPRAEVGAGHSETHDDAGRSGGVVEVIDAAEAAGIPLLELSAGQVLSFGSVELTVLAPGRSASVGAEGANDRSLVVRARTPVGTVLFTGDIEAQAQGEVMRGRDIRTDILKVPHHGSRTTTPEFLRAVGPRLALVSAGADNSFGHPHASVVTALAALGTTIARTDHHGDVVVFGTVADLRTATSRRRRAGVPARRWPAGCPPGRWGPRCAAPRRLGEPRRRRRRTSSSSIPEPSGRGRSLRLRGRE
ncbi:ComEC/Rec2 family competence protein [Nocardia halotolerans]|uniref:ComEC/Rec2 family competence protein n=1 Tax=Nocardia halotolerans TaxID=1755878 RepID=A0ABV8V9Z8_9NOCA